ncbi:MAG: hypothetical protein ACP5NG_05135, partial [Conexivisphaera sp.]
LRSRLGGPDPGPVLASVARDERALLEAYRGKVLRVLSYGLLRALWWANGGEPPGEPPGEREVALWLLSTASIGRAGLPDRPQLAARRSRDLAEAVRGDFDRLAKRVDEEQRAIMEDAEYWEILDAAGSTGAEPGAASGKA